MTLSPLQSMDAPQLLVSHDVDDLPEPYIWDEEDILPEHLTELPLRTLAARGAALPKLPDLYPGRSYYVANSIEAELRDFNQLFPKRSKASDGWLGNASHQAHPSDHNPAWNAGGIIRAGDLTTTSWGIAGGKYTAEQRKWHQDLIADLIATEKANPIDRLWYLIHWIPGDAYPKIWSRSTNWEPKRYTGPSPHDHHFHTSIMRTNAAAGDTKRWFTKFLKYLPDAEQPEKPPIKPSEVDTKPDEPKPAEPAPAPVTPAPEPEPTVPTPQPAATKVSVIEGGKITSPFGYKANNPATGKSYWAAGYHPGDDWNKAPQDSGLPALSAVSGKVVHAGTGAWGSAYGIHVIVEDTHGHRTAHCHLSKKSVSSGDFVHAGQELGKVGSTGNVTGPHCHVEERVAPFTYASHVKPSYEDEPERIDLSDLLKAIEAGKKSSLIEKLQQHLKDHGRKVSVDGWWGPETKKAVQWVQVHVLGAGAGTSGADGKPGKGTLTVIGFIPA
jgi:murein DD-endopeptidase MepM/ murein hydrolase activator NlpD